MSDALLLAGARCVGSSCRHAVTPVVTDGQALTMLLTTESLLLTVLSLSITLASPRGRRPRAMPISPGVLAAGAVTTVWIVGTGAGFAWVKIFAHDFPHDLPSRAVAVVIALAIILEPLYALFLAFGIRARGE